MRRLNRPLPRVLWVVLIGLLAVRAPGVYWHLCFDGSEPPSRLHFGALAPVHDSLESAGHEDTDVSAAFDLAARTAKAGFDLAPVLPSHILFFAFLVCVLVFVRIERVRGEIRVVPFFLRPPSRGPPR